MTKPKPSPCIDHIKNAVDYCQETGTFTWKKARGVFKAGDKAGSQDKFGYIRICINQKKWPAHRLAWLIVHGTWPENYIDHINGVPWDNRISNLRPATDLENSQSKGALATNTSGFVGVYFRKGRWVAQTSYKNTGYYIGTYDTPEEAHAAYLKRKSEIHTFQPTLRNNFKEGRQLRPDYAQAIKEARI